MVNPKIVLIHGAFGDASSWRPVFDRLVGGGHTAISQRSVSAAAFDDPATAADWRAKPSWAVFGTADSPIAPDLHRCPRQS